MRIGVIASSGGAVFEALVAVTRRPPADWVVVTDRPCGIEALAARLGIAHTRIEAPDNQAFSAAAASVLRDAGVDLALLFFLRLVTEAVYTSIPTYNIHPSLLPAFRGFHAVRRAREAAVRILGATLHVADHSADGGAILAQAVDPIDPAWPIALWERVSFRQKVVLAAWLVAAREAGDGALAPPAVVGASGLIVPGFRDPALLGRVEAWLAQHAPIMPP